MCGHGGEKGLWNIIRGKALVALKRKALKRSLQFSFGKREKNKRRGIAPLERKSPPFLQNSQKGWGALKFRWEWRDAGR